MSQICSVFIYYLALDIFCQFDSKLLILYKNYWA